VTHEIPRGDNIRNRDVVTTHEMPRGDNTRDRDVVTTHETPVVVIYETPQGYSTTTLGPNLKQTSNKRLEICDVRAFAAVQWRFVQQARSNGSEHR
jgi:hypothetical protein